MTERVSEERKRGEGVRKEGREGQRGGRKGDRDTFSYKYSPLSFSQKAQKWFLYMGKHKT